MQTIIGDTIEDAQAKYRQMQELIHPEVGLFLLQVRTEVRIFGASSQSHVVPSIPAHEEV